MSEELNHKGPATAADRGSSGFSLTYIETVASLDPQTSPAAWIEVRHTGRTHSEVATGTGGLDAVFNALNAIVGIDGRLEKLDLRFASKGPADVPPDVLAIAIVKIGTRFFHGSAQAEDIMSACARAYLAALERCHRGRPERPPRYGASVETIAAGGPPRHLASAVRGAAA